ncbi:MAG: hypothetical protein HY360_12205 [Verrucomicrobia bacterium]|nr:hypothetical protein [Verrucomicrobiota bacterium]
MRDEIAQRFGARINGLQWQGEGYDGTKTYHSTDIVCVPDLFTTRK